MTQDEPLFRCTICGREGSVGRCCGDETRIPLNEAASKTQQEDIERKKREELKERVLYRSTTFA